MLVGSNYKFIIIQLLTNGLMEKLSLKSDIYIISKYVNSYTYFKATVMIEYIIKRHAPEMINY